MKRKAFTNLKRKLSVRLDTTYFAKNWKLKIIKKNNFCNTVHSFNIVTLPTCTVHIPGTMQEALVKKKKRKKEKKKCGHRRGRGTHNPNGT